MPSKTLATLREAQAKAYKNVKTESHLWHVLMLVAVLNSPLYLYTSTKTLTVLNT